MQGSYIDQAKRVLRSFQKLPKKVLLKKANIRTIDNYYHFFQDAHHLKDWIKNDKQLSQKTRKDVEVFVKNNSTLKILQSLANATKHLSLNNNLNEYKEIDIITDFAVDIRGNEGQLLNVKYNSPVLLRNEAGEAILTENGEKLVVEGNEIKTLNAKMFALKVLISWNKFFIKHNLKAGYRINLKS